MKNITILLTILCAMAGPFALTQSVLKLSPTNAMQDTILINIDGVESTTLRISDEQGNVQTVDPVFYGTGDFAYYVKRHLPGDQLFITPSNPLDPLNGVNTYDLILISQHILGKELLDSPYKIIAADADRSGRVTTFDIVELRKLILGTYTELPQNPSWRFIDKKQVFSNPLNPFTLPLRETVNPYGTNPFIEAPKPYRADFVRVKVGDVDLTATPNNFQATEDRTTGTYHFNINDQLVKKGQTYTITFTGERPISGYQFTLNARNLALKSVIPGADLTPDHFGIFANKNTSDWSPVLTAAVENGATTFSISVKALADGYLHEMLQTSAQITPDRAYTADGSAENIALFFQKETTTIGEIQVSPNPFTSSCQIGFTLPEDHTTTLRIYDASGKLVCTKSLLGKKGYQTFQMESSEMPGTGVFSFTLEAGNWRQSGKLVKQ